MLPGSVVRGIFLEINPTFFEMAEHTVAFAVVVLPITTRGISSLFRRFTVHKKNLSFFFTVPFRSCFASLPRGCDGLITLRTSRTAFDRRKQPGKQRHGFFAMHRFNHA